jgi:hypothetical protein
MAVRRTIVFLGDTTASGNRAPSELAAINPSYDDPQADCLIWNIQAQLWQSLTPGTNTNTAVIGSDRWSYESRFRESVRAEFATGNLYVIKYALDSTLAYTAAKPSWVPGIAGNAYASLLTQVTNAAAAAQGVGDTIQIDGIVISLMTDDFKLSTWRSYGPFLRTLIDNLRAALPAISFCAAGSFRDDGKPTPVVLIEPHFEFTGLTDLQKGALNSSRLMLQGLESEIERIRVVRTHLQTSTDNLTFSSTSMVDIAIDIGRGLFEEVAFDDSSLPEGRMLVIAGDSTVEGVGDPVIPGTGQISDLPTHLQGALSGAAIWRPDQGDFATLQVGVNNMISLPSVLGGFGPEILLSSELRGSGDVWVVKGTAINTFGGVYHGTMAAAVPPLYDRSVVCWPPAARGQMFDLTMRGWFRSAVIHMREQLARAPKVELVLISVGTNDARFDEAAPTDVVNGVRSFIACFLEMLTDLGISSKPRFVVCVPSSSIDTAGTIREPLLALADLLENVSVVDLSNYSTADGVHLTGAEQIRLGSDVASIWRREAVSAVQPMFMPSMTDLRKALRLSKIGLENDALSLIDQAVQTVKAEFFRFLGEARISDLQKIAYTRTPKSNSDYLRVLASNIEVKWVRAQLLRSMPTMFMDGATPVASWQEESAFRFGNTLQTRDELKRLDQEIKEGLQTLKDAQFSESGVFVDTVSPDSSITPGQTVFDVF